MITCKCGCKMPQHMTMPLKCSCGEPLGMFVMVDAQTFEGIQAVLVAVESLVLSEVQTPEENLSRVVAIKDAYKRMK